MHKVPKLIAITLNRTFRTGSSEHQVKGIHWRYFGLLIKLILSVGVLYFIYFRLRAADEQLSLRTFITGMQFNANILLLSFCALLCMSMNWAIEVIKWKALMNQHKAISWRRATKGVLSGISFGLFSPNRVGEFFGRVLTLDAGSRISGAVLSMVNGLAQTVATFTFGIIILMLHFYSFGVHYFGILPSAVIQLVLVLALAFSLIFFYRIDVVSEFIMRWPRLSRYARHIELLNDLPNKLLTRLYLLSLLRFTLFILQYIIVFGLMLPVQGVMEVFKASALTLFSITLLPFVPVPDLLLRESFALSYFELYEFEPMAVGIVVFVVWLINIAFPAIIGTVGLFTFRFFRHRE